MGNGNERKWIRESEKKQRAVNEGVGGDTRELRLERALRGGVRVEGKWGKEVRGVVKH